MAKLIFTDQPFSGRSYELVLEKTTVGRGDENTLVIRDSSLSSKHCEILFHGPEVIIRDLGSRNGTFVDNVRLHNQQSQLKSGQVVRFGGVNARLELDSSDIPKEDTAETAVFTHKQIMREQRRAKNRPPVNPAQTFESLESPESDEQTIFIPRDPSLALALNFAEEKPAAGPAAPRGGIGKWVLTAVVVLGLVLLAWWLWRGH